MKEKDRIASKGRIWVCLACGKTSRDKYGDKESSYGWDVSCVMNCQLFDKDLLVYDKHGRVKQVKEKKEENNEK